MEAFLLAGMGKLRLLRFRLELTLEFLSFG
jgi:hypothetical protein